MSHVEDVLKFNPYKYCDEVFGKATQDVKPLRVMSNSLTDPVDTRSFAQFDQIFDENKSP